MTKIYGDTYAVKEQLKKLGGRWVNGSWVVPDDKAEAAWALLGGKPAPRATRTWDTVAGPVTAELWTKSGDHGIVKLIGGGPRVAGRFDVLTPDAVAEFVTMAAHQGEDFDGEATFSDWVNYVYLKRHDVAIVI